MTEHVGYGVTVKGKPTGLWPVTLAFARRSAQNTISKGIADRSDVAIVAVHAGDSVPLTDPAPIFPAKDSA
jgi:hypothetical protein